MRKAELEHSFCCKVARSIPDFTVADYLLEMTAKKSCEYDVHWSFESLLFSLSHC